MNMLLKLATFVILICLTRIHIW